MDVPRDEELHPGEGLHHNRCGGFPWGRCGQLCIQDKELQGGVQSHTAEHTKAAVGTEGGATGNVGERQAAACTTFALST